MSGADAETVAAYLLERVRAARGPLWDEGPARLEVARPPRGEALASFARRRIRGVPEVVARGLLAWGEDRRPADVRFDVPTAREMLWRQAEGRRYVCLLDDEAARAHEDPRHPDGLSFLLHDLCHLEKFVTPEHHAGQIGFFRCVARALERPPLLALQQAFDDQWLSDRDYVISDMNGSAIFLFSALKMKLNMAVRRRLAAARGVAAPTTGRLSDDERTAVEPALATLLEAMALPTALRRDASLVSTRRDHPAEARRLLAHFEMLGTSGRPA